MLQIAAEAVEIKQRASLADHVFEAAHDHRLMAWIIGIARRFDLISNPGGRRCRRAACRRRFSIRPHGIAGPAWASSLRPRVAAHRSRADIIAPRMTPGPNRSLLDRRRDFRTGIN